MVESRFSWAEACRINTEKSQARLYSDISNLLHGADNDILVLRFKMHIFAALLTAVLAFVVIVSTQAAKTQPCVSPKMWEAAGSCRNDNQKVTSSFKKLSYDALKKRIRVLLRHDRAHKEYIVLYKEHRLYTIENSTDKCTVSEYDKPFPTFEIPRNATFVSKEYLGLENQGCGRLNYQGTFDSEGNKGTYFTGVTEKFCALVYSQVTSKGIVKSVSFLNITLGIKDPSVFTPPKLCDKGPVPEDFCTPNLGLY